ncbi:hypothetical protein F5I97DRAFT_1444769 [Phlebopus sp. FC_14]|nr:hypothetical protein F5I97DRAFT_1444769 [Phlebopus sp. FC_14]
MHHTLLIDEIVSRICDHLYEDIRLDCKAGIPQTLGDLNALARASKVFSEQALDALWRTQWSLAPLISCLPSATVVQQRRYTSGKWTPCQIVSLRSTPSSAEWETIAPYGLRIKHLAGPSPLNAVYLIDQESLGMLFFDRLTPLLANLSTVSHLGFPIEPSSRLYPTWLYCVLTKKLGGLVLEYPYEASANDLDSAVRQLATRSPELSNLSFTCPFRPTGDSTLLPDFLEPLSKLKNLESFRLTLKSETNAISSSRASCIYPFSRLRDMTLACGTVNQAVEAMWAIDADNLQRLRISATYYSQNSSAGHQSPVLAVELGQQARWISTLESLSIVFPPHSVSPFQPDPLFAFTNLKLVQLYNIDLDLTDSLARKMVRTWPLIEKITLYFTQSSSRSFPLTFFGIFVTSWPQLTYLQTNAKIDPSVEQRNRPAIPNLAPETSYRPTSKPGLLTFVMTSGSVVRTPDAVARWIYDVSHPKSVHLTFDEPSHGIESWECVQHELKKLYEG